MTGALCQNKDWEAHGKLQKKEELRTPHTASPGLQRRACAVSGCDRSCAVQPAHRRAVQAQPAARGAGALSAASHAPGDFSGWSRPVAHVGSPQRASKKGPGSGTGPLRLSLLEQFRRRGVFPHRSGPILNKINFVCELVQLPCRLLRERPSFFCRIDEYQGTMLCGPSARIVNAAERTAATIQHPAKIVTKGMWWLLLNRRRASL